MSVCDCLHMYARELEKRGRLVILEANRQFNNWIEIVQGA